MMDPSDSNDLALRKIAAGEAVPDGTWPQLRVHVIARLDEIARTQFPIPNLPTPPPPYTSSQEANKENVPKPTAAQPLAPGQLPAQIDVMLVDIKKHLETFPTHAPHTIQRLAELILEPKAHYKALASYLHAVDRVVRVTSGTNMYPLPPAVLDMSAMQRNGDEVRDAAADVSWDNPAATTLGTDEALGGALLTPIPWLTRANSDGSNGDSTTSGGAQIHSEGTETIEGPNGVGSIETVSVSVNGIPSTGHARGVTQGELLRQEQRAGVVPVSQLARTQGPDPDHNEDHHDDEDGEANEIPHARGPEEIGVNDTGPQGVTTSYMGEEGVLTHDIDVEAAVGRKHDGGEAQPKADVTSSADEPADASQGASTKREARPEEEEEEEEEGQPAKRVKEEEAAPMAKDEGAADTAAAAATTPTVVGGDSQQESATEETDGET